MRIAVVGNSAWYILNFRYNLIRALSSAGHQVIAISPIGRGDYDKRLLEDGIDFRSVSISAHGINPFRELRSILDLYFLLREIDAELVLSYIPKFNIYSAIASRGYGIPFVPNVSGVGSVFTNKSLLALLVKLLYRLTFSYASRVFFQNYDDLETFKLMKLVRAEQCERLPGSGIDLQRFEPRPLPQRDLDMPLFLLVARLLWDKGIGKFVEAARQVRRHYPKARFQLIGPMGGDSPAAIDRAQIETWINEGLVEYLGFVEDVRPSFANANCVVLPSYREGVPRALLEAAAMERPIITTDAPGCRDAIIDGESGFLCRPADSQDLAEKMLRFIELRADQREAFGKRGRLYMQEVFDEHIVLKRYLSLIEELEAQYKPGNKQL